MNVTSHEDIDFFWDNPAERMGRRQDILDIIEKRISSNKQVTAEIVNETQQDQGKTSNPQP